MKSSYLVWTGHFLALVLVLFGFWWLSEHLSGMPYYKLAVALVAMTGLILNHFRWASFGGKVNDQETYEKINLLVVSNYLVLLLAFMLVDI
jgi:hypothetical protein